MGIPLSMPVLIKLKLIELNDLVNRDLILL